MPELFAHSGQVVKSEVSYLRRALFAGPCYPSAMELRLRELRKQKGWTVQQLADAVGLSKSYVSDIETGKRPANSYRLERFAKALGVGVFDLIDDKTIDADARTLLLDFQLMSAEHRALILQTARAFRDRSESGEPHL